MNFKEFLQEATNIEESEDLQFVSVMLGGSIGSMTIHSIRDLKGSKIADDALLFSNKPDAKEKAKRMNKHLSPGEKKYYGMKYVVAAVSNGVYTGK